MDREKLIHLSCFVTMAMIVFGTLSLTCYGMAGAELPGLITVIFLAVASISAATMMVAIIIDVMKK